jgi:hypothetical protein
VEHLFEEAAPGRRDWLDRAAERFQRDLRGQPEIQADLLIAVSHAYSKLGLPEPAAAASQAALAIRQRLFGARHPKVAESLTALARLEAEEEDVKAAELHHRRALAIRRKLRDDGHAVGQLGSPSAARFLFCRAVNIERPNSGKPSWELASGLRRDRQHTVPESGQLGNLLEDLRPHLRLSRCSPLPKFR